MSNARNTTQLIGNLGADPETRAVNNTEVSTFSLAYNESYKTKTGEEVSKTSWFRVEAWGATSEIVKSLRKGDQVMVHGKLIADEYTTKEGDKRTVVKVRANRVYKHERAEVAALPF